MQTTEIKTIVPGHSYQLANRDDVGQGAHQTLNFEKRLTNKELKALGLEAFEGVDDDFQNIIVHGVYTQDVVKVLAKRVLWQMENELACEHRERVLVRLLDILHEYDNFEKWRQKEEIYHVKREDFQKGIIDSELELYLKHHGIRD